MEPAYHSKSFIEIPTIRKCSTGRSDNNIEDSCFSFNLSDDSFNSNSSTDSNKSNEKKNDGIKNCDLLPTSDEENKSGREIDINGVNSQNHKSSHSIIKILKRFSTRNDSSHQKRRQSILRQPTEYIFVKGMSGVQIRVAKPSSSSSSSSYQR